MPPPSMYEEVLAAALADRVANGEPLAKICKDKDMPGRTTVYRWMQQNEHFAQMMAQARLDAADSLADDMLQIADNRNLPPDARRVMVDTRKWIASKLKPQVYSDRLAVQHGGNVVVNMDQPGDDKL